MRVLNEGNIRKILFVSSISLVAILSISFFGLYVLERYQNLKQNILKIEQNFVDHQKEMLSFVVNLQVNRIEYERRQIKKRIQEYLKEHIDEAKLIAHTLLEKNAPQQDVIQRNIVLEALASLRFNHGEGYFFSIGLDEKIRFFPPNKSFEGKKISECFNPEQQQIIRKMISIVQKYNDGFLEYLWPLPGSDQKQLLKKMSYVTYCEPLNGFIGTDVHFKTFRELTKRDIAANIEQFMGKDPKNYFFIYDLHDIYGGKEFATMLVNPNRPDLIGRKLSDDYKDAHGKTFRKEFLKQLREKGEAFVTYWYKKPDSQDPKQKLSYFKLYPEWNWVVAKGVYLDDLESMIQNEKIALETSVKKRFITFSVFFLIAVILVVLIAHFFTRGINAIFVEYKRIQDHHHAELESINQQLHKQATTDTLTQLYNRCHFNEQLKLEMGIANRYGRFLALIIFDIDHFKRINDTYGHICGDTVLKELADLMRKNVRGSDILARWGGEEFVLLMHEVNKDVIADLATRLCDSVANFDFSIDSQVTCSFGVTMYQAGECEIDFINRADGALYRAKSEGRNRVVIM